MKARASLDGATVLVTGASSGIGRELAIKLGARVKTLVLIARRADRLEQLRTELAATYPGLRAIAFAVDLSDEDEVARMLDRVRGEIGPVDVLVNNAGIGDSALFDRAQWSRTRQVLRTNVMAIAQLTEALVPDMVARARGGVLNIGSGAGLTVMPGAAAYSASKHFIDGFSEALRVDLAGTGVVVTQVCPGPVETEFDDAAGLVGGMSGGPPPFVQISAEQCAREAVAGFDRGLALVFPGRSYRMMMRFVLPLFPRALRRWQAAKTARRLRQPMLTTRRGPKQYGRGDLRPLHNRRSDE